MNDTFKTSCVSKTIEVIGTEKKVRAIYEYKKPITFKKIGSVLGLATHKRKYEHMFAADKRTLRRCIRKMPRSGVVT
jgi:ribosomal protein L19E